MLENVWFARSERIQQGDFILFLRLLRLPGTSGMLLTFQGLTSLESSDMTQKSHSWRMGYRCSDLWTLVPFTTDFKTRPAQGLVHRCPDEIMKYEYFAGEFCLVSPGKFNTCLRQWGGGLTSTRRGCEQSNMLLLHDNQYLNATSWNKVIL